MLSDSEPAFDFATKLLPKVHTLKDLGPAFFATLLQKLNPEEDRSKRVVKYAAEELAKFDLNALAPELLKWLALFPFTQTYINLWVNQGKLKLQTVGIDFWKLIAFQPDWDASPWLVEFKAKNGQWAKELSFDDGRAGVFLGWFADVRKVSNGELGFSWLMKLVARSEPLYHDFASDRLIRTFLPADFAPTEGAAQGTGASASGPVDLAKASFCFTGTPANITVKDAEAQVKAANGTVAANVSPKLHYLVVGDTGSPFLGTGQKGAKYLKAEELNEKGANIRIISETMFLQMLAGEKRSAATTDAVGAGCERLWQLVIAPGPADAPVGAVRARVRSAAPPGNCQEDQRQARRSGLRNS